MFHHSSTIPSTSLSSMMMMIVPETEGTRTIPLHLPLHLPHRPVHDPHGKKDHDGGEKGLDEHRGTQHGIQRGMIPAIATTARNRKPIPDLSTLEARAVRKDIVGDEPTIPPAGVEPING